MWIDQFRGVPAPQVGRLNALLDAMDPDSGEPEPPTVLMGDLVLMEILRGISDDRTQRRIRTRLLVLPQVTLGGTDIALAAADHYRALRRIGITVRKTVDCLIAAWCIAHRVPLLHSDRDFDPFAEHCGLQCMAAPS